MRERRQSRRNVQNWVRLSADFDAAVEAADDRQRRELAAQIFRELLPSVPPGAMSADGREALAQARTRPEWADADTFRSLADRVENSFGEEVPDEYNGVVDVMHSWADHLESGDPGDLAVMAVDHLLWAGGGSATGLGAVDPMSPTIHAKSQQLLTLLGRR